MKSGSSTFKGLMQRMISFLCALSFLLASDNVFAENKDLVLFDYQEEGQELKGSVASIPVTSLPVSIFASTQATSTIVIDNGDSNNRIDLVFLADGYTAAEQDSFNNAVPQFTNGMFQQTPFKEYKEFFNIHRVNISSVDSGARNYPENGVEKNTALGSYFYCNGAANTICTNVSKAWEYAAQSRGQDQIIVLSNTTANGASAYPFSALSVVSAGHSAGADSLLHQLGHSFGNLADEYSSGSWHEYTGFEPAEINVSAQNTLSMINQKLKWHHWLGENSSDPVLGTISSYVGGMGYQSGIYRPTLTSKMRDLSKPFNDPSIEAFIKEIYKKVDLIDDATPSDVLLTGSDTLFISYPKPTHNDLLFEWYVGGVLVEGSDQHTFRPNDYPFKNGIQEVRVKVTDKTSMVKDELFRSEYMQEERAWNVEITQVSPTILTHPDTLSLFVDEQGSFAVSASGEDLSYQWYKNGILLEGSTESTYTTLPVTREDHNSSYHVVVSNIAGMAESEPAKLYIKNRAPVLYEIPNFAMSRTETFQFSLKVSDPDGDTLSFTVEPLDEVENEILSVTTVNTKLHIAGNNAPLGTRRFRVTASDGEFESIREFSILVRNNPPVITPIPEVKMKPGSAPFHVPFTAYDPDGDPLSFSVAIITSGARASVSVDGNSILVVPENDYIGSFTVRLDASDEFQNVFAYFKVSIANTSPIITSLPLVNRMHWREKELVIPIIAHDPDGDELIYTVEPLTQTNRVTLVMSGNSIVMTKDDTYLGFFYAKAIVSDGFNTTERNFYINVANKFPLVETIPPVSMHWKAGFVDIPLTIIDPDPLDAGHHSCSAVTVGNTPNVLFEMDNCVLRIISPNKYLGSFSMLLYAHDGISSSTPRGLQVTVYNSPPTIDSIPDQIIRKGVLSHMVRVPASDPDGDELTITAEVAEPGKASVLAFDIQDETLVITPQNGFNGSIPVKVSVSDGIASTSTTFNFVSENKPPVLTPLPDLRLHWIQDQVYVLELFADDPDDTLENLVFTAEILKSTLPDSTLQVSGNTLNITMPEKFLGSFLVKITVSDGEFHDSGIFTVYSTNAPPEISPVCDHAFTHAEVPYEINLEVVDPDEEELEYTVRLEHYPLPYELKSTYQFRRPDDGWRYNTIGLGEKFLRGIHEDSNEDGWFIITPTGDLYQFEGTLASSKHVAKLPEVYHTDPDLLVNAVLPVGSPDVQVTSQEEVLRVIPGPEYKGTIIVFVRAEDQQLFDEESFLVTVYGHEIFLDTHRNLEFHWREQGQLLFKSQSESILPIQYEVGFSDTSEAFALQENHKFGEYLPRGHYQTDNATGKGEKYFLGTQGSANHFLYAMLSTGEVFLCHGSVSGGSLVNSELLGRVSPLFYQYPELWYAVPPPGEAPLEFIINETSLRIIPEKGFTGKAIISISAIQDQSTDTQDVLVSVYNTIPSLEAAQGISFSNSPIINTSWKAGEISVPLTYFDLDAVDQGELRLYVKEGMREEYLRSLIAEHEIYYRADNVRFNENGWREKFLSGQSQGLDVNFVILPQGGVYQWEGTIEESALIGFLSEDYYTNPELINVLRDGSDLYQAVGAHVRVEGSHVVIQPPDDFTGRFTMYVEVWDGISARGGEFGVEVVNSPPAFSLLGPVTKHMRGGPALTVLHATDPDNDPLQFSISGVASNGGELPVGVELDGNAVLINNAPLYKGSFSVLASVTDGTHAAQSQFPVHVVNNPPILSSISDRVFGWEQLVGSIPLQYYDPDVQDADRLSVHGFVGTIRSLAHTLDSRYHFRAAANGRVSNQAGYGEKYIQGMDGSMLREFVILPGGGLYLWDINAPIEPAIAFLPLNYYENPALLLTWRSQKHILLPMSPYIMTHS
jgi:hypothetical protein